MTPAKCSSCGFNLPTDAPGGLCPRCLLQGDPAVAAESPATSPYPGPGTVPTPAELQPLFPQLEILELLGQGGMGIVYKARQLSLDRIVAVKILPHEADRDPSFAERFQREAKALARLNHPNIVAVHDFGSAGSYYFFVMEYVEGINLRQAIKAGDLQPAEALRIVPLVCEALQYAHDEGVVHRDIKPENILLDKRGRVKMADFGLAKLLGLDPDGVSLTGTRQVMGTFHYMAPEQVEGTRNVDHRADIYSLGVTFYEMLTGELPLGRFAPPSQKVEVDIRLDEVVLRALATDPEKRYQHASDVKTEVEIIGRSPAAPKPSDLPPLEQLVVTHWPQGKIAAVIAYRKETGVGLAEAKQAVEVIATKHQLPGWDRSYGIFRSCLILLAVCACAALAALLKLSALIWMPLVLGLVVVPQGYRAWKLWGTPEGQRAAILAGSFAFLILGLPLLTFLAQPEPMLQRLYALTGAEPGPHDALFLRGIFTLLIGGGFVWLVAAFLKQRQVRAKKHATSLPRYSRWVGIPMLVFFFLHLAGTVVAISLAHDEAEAWLAASAAGGGGLIALFAEFLGLNLAWLILDLVARASNRDAAPATSDTPQSRPRVVLVIALLNLLSAVIIIFIAGHDLVTPDDPEDPTYLVVKDKPFYAVWRVVDPAFGYLAGIGLFASGIGLLLWKSWARRMTIVILCVELAGFALQIPALIAFVIQPAFSGPDAVQGVEGVLLACLMGLGTLFILAFLVWQLITLQRPHIVAAFAASPAA